MRDTRIMMGMPITVEVVGTPDSRVIDLVFDYFDAVDRRFSLYKDDSEISRLNRGEVRHAELSPQMREVFNLADQTKTETNGYFDVKRSDGAIDPSGIVKGWAIRNAAKHIRNAGFQNYYVEAGGDIQADGKNSAGSPWRVGIRSPFNNQDIVKAIQMSGKGIATSGSYVRGQHIYNPHALDTQIEDIVSISVIGPDVLEADRFATAAFAMGEDGAYFIESLEGFEAYMINADGIATMTTGFGDYVVS
jgi:FAD:protein FMN transferase